MDKFISNQRVSLFLLLPCFIEIPPFNANSVDPDQMQHYAASDLGLSLFANVPFYGPPGKNGLRKYSVDIFCNFYWYTLELPF